VGFALDPHFAPTSELLEVFSVPILNKLGAQETSKSRFAVQIDPHNPFALNFSTDDGYQYAVAPGQISISFIHRVRVRTVQGGPPVLQTLSKATPYTQQLGTVLEKLIEATLLLPGPRNRTVTRCGIVTTTRLAAD
jgi:hypothetical protein